MKASFQRRKAQTTLTATFDGGGGVETAAADRMSRLVVGDTPSRRALKRSVNQFDDCKRAGERTKASVCLYDARRV